MVVGRADAQGLESYQSVQLGCDGVYSLLEVNSPQISVNDVLYNYNNGWDVVWEQYGKKFSKITRIKLF